MKLIDYNASVSGGMMGGYSLTSVTYTQDGRCLVSTVSRDFHSSPTRKEKYYADGLLDKLSEVCERYQVIQWTDLPEQDMRMCDAADSSQCFTFEDGTKICLDTKKRYPLSAPDMFGELNELIRNSESYGVDKEVTIEENTMMPLGMMNMGMMNMGMMGNPMNNPAQAAVKYKKIEGTSLIIVKDSDTGLNLDCKVEYSIRCVVRIIDEKTYEIVTSAEPVEDILKKYFDACFGMAFREACPNGAEYKDLLADNQKVSDCIKNRTADILASNGISIETLNVEKISLDENTGNMFETMRRRAGIQNVDPVSSAEWICICGEKNTGKFCRECGTPRGNR